MSTQTDAKRRERHANLLAGLNDAPSALTGWPDVLEVAYELGGRRPGTRYSHRPDVLTPRRIRLARTWTPYASEGIAKAFAGIIFPAATKEDFVLVDGSRK